MRILVIDDEEYVRIKLEEALRSEGCHVTAVGSGREGLKALEATSFDCVITDLRMPGTDGREILQWVREHQPDVDVIVLTGQGEIHSAALAKLTTVRTLRRENVALRFGAGPAEEIVSGPSTAWKALMETVQKIAPAAAPVLIQGEIGSGKELVARALHGLSPRRTAPFIAVNCGAVSAQLLESELFGHERGAFTGATSAKIGLIAAAEGGTLFLDEISEMSGPMQVSLLRVLDRKEYRQVGGTRTLTANVRFIAASNRDLQDLVLAGRFRDDLLYRINTVLLRVPPLRERPEDIPVLAQHFLKTLRVGGVPPREWSTAALARLGSYPWPGNVRELRNAIERLMLLSGGGKTGVIEVDALDAVLPVAAFHPTAGRQGPVDSLEDAEKTHIRRVLQAYAGNKSQTARALRIDYKTLLAKLRKDGLSS